MRKLKVTLQEKYPFVSNFIRMKFTMALLIIAITIMVFNVQGQDLKNGLSANIGIGTIARQDLVFSPFIHKDFTPVNVGLEYTRKANYFQKLNIRYASFNPMLATPYEFHHNGESKVASQHYFTIINLDYSFGMEIIKSEKSSTTAGVLFAADVQLLNYVYGRIGNFGYYSILGLGGFISKEYQINEKSRFSGRISLPLINWFARSPYLVNDDEFIENINSHSDLKSFFAFIGDGNIATLNKLQTFDIEAGYTYRLSNRWEIGLSYLFEFIHARDPRSLLSYRNSFFVSTNLKF